MSTVKDIYNSFNKEIDEISDLLSKSIELYDNKEVSYDKSLHYKIVESCFVDMYNLFESFIENAFISYMLGSSNIKGINYTCFVTPNDAEHAYGLLKGRNSFPRFTDITEICLLAKLFFENRGPFEIFCMNPKTLQDIKLVRNFISHNSINARDKYKNVLISNSQLPNLSPAEFLLTFEKTEKKMFYTLYEEFIRFLVDEICGA